MSSESVEHANFMLNGTDDFCRAKFFMEHSITSWVALLIVTVESKEQNSHTKCL
jgi:hypothetical protein